MARITSTELAELQAELEGLRDSANTLIEDLTAKRSAFDADAVAVDQAKQQAEEASAATTRSSTEAAKALEGVIEAKDTVESTADGISDFGGKLATIKEALERREATLESLQARSEALKAQVEGLLPGATSAGLASAFKERKDSFVLPIRIWSGIFLTAIIGLLVVAAFNPSKGEVSLPADTDWWTFFGSRLPFVIPLVWLAMYAGRRHGQALRLQEEYAHKEALSKSFEGYKTQLMDLGGESEGEAVTAGLIENTLNALSIHPGRVYLGNQGDISPMHSTAEAVKDAATTNETPG